MGTEIGCTGGPDRQERGGRGEADADREADEPRTSTCAVVRAVSRNTRKGHEERSPISEGRNTPAFHLYSPALVAARYAADAGYDTTVKPTLRRSTCTRSARVLTFR